MTRQQAVDLIRLYEITVREDEVSGSGHPDLFEWRAERAKIMRERVIRKLCGDERRTPNLPRQPEVDYEA